MKTYYCRQCVEFREADNGEGYCKLADILVDGEREACIDFVKEENNDD